MINLVKNRLETQNLSKNLWNAISKKRCSQKIQAQAVKNLLIKFKYKKSSLSSYLMI